MDRETRRHAQRCGLTFGEASKIVKDSMEDFHPGRRLIREIPDDGESPSESFKKRMREPEPDSSFYPR